MKNHVWVVTIATLGFTTLLAPRVARADVKVERFTHFGGVFGMGANDTTTTDYLQGLKKRDESDVKFTGSVLGALQRFRHGDNGSQSVNIMRVDQNLIFDLNPDDKTYTEHPLYQPSEEESSASAQAGGGNSKQQNETKVTKNEFTVKTTGQKKSINGFDTSEYLITWDVETVNTKTGEKGKSLMTTDLWTAEGAKLEKAREEELTYSKAYLKLMKLPTNPDELKLYGFGVGPESVSVDDSKAFFAKLRTIKGYPISVDVTWKASDNGQKNGGSSGGEQEQGVQGLGSALGSLFGSQKKADDSGKSSDGMATIFTSHTEVKSIDIGALPASLFEVPTDYKKD